MILEKSDVAVVFANSKSCGATNVQKRKKHERKKTPEDLVTSLNFLTKQA